MRRYQSQRDQREQRDQGEQGEGRIGNSKIGLLPDDHHLEKLEHIAAERIHYPEIQKLWHKVLSKKFPFVHFEQFSIFGVLSQGLLFLQS